MMQREEKKKGGITTPFSPCECSFEYSLFETGEGIYYIYIYIIK